MINSKNRISNFTSSEIAALMTKDRKGDGFGAPAKTYIAEKRMEQRLGRSLNTETSSKPTSWGSLVEQRVFDILGTDYKFLSKETIVHPEINYWSGSPDGIKFVNGNQIDAVIDIKAPITLKSFCQLVDCKTIDEVRENHKQGEDYYWQLVSNAILTGAKFAELIVYCPYQKELIPIRELATNYDGNQNKFAWIYFSEDIDLPFLIQGKHYKNLNIIRWEVDETDKLLLTGKVIEAGKLLNQI